MNGDISIDDLLNALRALVRSLRRPASEAAQAEQGRHLATIFTELDQRLSGGEPVPTPWAPSMTVPGDYPPCPLPRCGGLVPATLPMCFAHWWKAPAEMREAYNIAIRENRPADRDRIGQDLVVAVAELRTGGQR